MSDKLNKAASVTPPVGGQNTIVRATVTTAERIKLPAAWRTGYVTVQADSTDVWCAFGPSTVVASGTATSTLTSEAVTAHGTGECQKIPSDDERSWNLDEIKRNNPEVDEIYFSHIAAATTGYVRLILSSGKVSLS